MRAMSWTVAAVTVQVWGHWGLGTGDAGVGAGRGTPHFFAVISKEYPLLE